MNILRRRYDAAAAVAASSRAAHPTHSLSMFVCMSVSIGVIAGRRNCCTRCTNVHSQQMGEIPDDCLRSQQRIHILESIYIWVRYFSRRKEHRDLFLLLLVFQFGGYFFVAQSHYHITNSNWCSLLIITGPGIRVGSFANTSVLPGWCFHNCSWA